MGPRALRCFPSHEALLRRISLRKSVSLAASMTAVFAAVGLAGATASATGTTGSGGVTNDTYSNSYSGYDIKGGSPRSGEVEASWVVPSIKCPLRGQTMVSMWTGLLATDRAHLIQTGIRSTCLNGQATYTGWWETIPGPENALKQKTFAVQPKDRIIATVSWIPQAPNYTVQLTNFRTHQTWSLGVKDKSLPMIPECIVEAPDVNHVLQPLANFGQVTLTGCQASNYPVASTYPGSWEYTRSGYLAEPSTASDSVNKRLGWTAEKLTDANKSVTRTSVSNRTADGHITVIWKPA